MITRTHVAGAIKLCNANNVPNRRGFIQNMLAAEHTAKDVAKVLADLHTYPEWSERADLDAVAPVDEAALPAKKKRGA